MSLGSTPILMIELSVLLERAMVKLILLSVLFALAGCTSVQYTPVSQLPIESGVQVLYEYPQDSKYKSLGNIDVYHYQPSWRAPRVSDVMPKLKERAVAVGGNALIVRSHQVGQMERSISVTAEVLVLD